MSWAEKLKGWAWGEPQRNESTDLRQLWVDLDRQAHRLARHAKLAPNEAAEMELCRMAAEQSAIADKLRDGVGDKVDSPPPVETAPPASLNHWARLVQDLEHMRSQRDRLFDAAKERDADDLPLSELLDELAQRIEVQLSRLRALIARADAQSLN
jgi:hypothetical protein